MSEKIRLLDRNGDVNLISVEDILAIRPTSDGPEFYTKDGMYFYPSTMEELQILFQSEGFERLDRTNLVNLNHVKAFDPKVRKVYFEEPWTKDSQFATVSEANVSKVQHLAKEKSGEYKTARGMLFGKS